MSSVTEAAFDSSRQQGLPSSMSRFSQSNAAFTSTLDKDLQDNKECHTTRHRDMEYRLIVVM